MASKEESLKLLERVEIIKSEPPLPHKVEDSTFRIKTIGSLLSHDQL